MSTKTAEQTERTSQRSEYSIDDAIAKAVRVTERTCVFIDNSNLFWAIRYLGASSKMNYVNLRKVLSDGRPTDIRFYYSEPNSPRDAEAQAKLDKQRGFYSFLDKVARYTMIKLPLREHIEYTSEGSQQVATEKGLDCEIAFDMCYLACTGKYTTFVLVAGDQDYARSVKKLREMGMKIEVAFFDGDRISQNLIREANSFVDLNSSYDELFCSPPPQG